MDAALPYLSIVVTLVTLLIGIGVWKGQKDSQDSYTDGDVKRLSKRLDDHEEWLRTHDRLIQQSALDIAVIKTKIGMPLG